MFSEQLKSIAQDVVDANQDSSEKVLGMIKDHYSDDIVSVEAAAGEDPSAGGPEHKGMEALMAKYAWWDENFEVHSSSAEGPFLHGEDRFGVIFEMDVTHKASGSRSQMKELGIYTVANGKIVREEFFYGLG